MEIPFDRRIAEAYSKGEMIVDTMPWLKDEFLKLYRDIKVLVES